MYLPDGGKNFIDLVLMICLGLFGKVLLQIVLSSICMRTPSKQRELNVSMNNSREYSVAQLFCEHRSHRENEPFQSAERVATCF